MVDVKRKEELMGKLKSKVGLYVRSLGGIGENEDIKDLEVSLRYMEALRIYEDLSRENKTPQFCVLYENIRLKDSRDGRLKGDISKDPVYSFLLKVKDSISEIASEEYNKEVSPFNHMRGKLELADEREYYASGKEHFLDVLLSAMVTRKSPSLSLVSWADKAKFTSERYEYLASLVKSANKDFERTAKNFVSFLPAYEWDIVSLPNERCLTPQVCYEGVNPNDKKIDVPF